MSENNPSTCPTDDQLRSLLDDSLAEVEQSQIQAHVDSCDVCQKKMEELTAGTESWDRAVVQLREQQNAPADPLLEGALRRLKQDEFAEESSEPFDPLEFLEHSDRPDSLGRLGAYEVLQVLGQGGMGVVLKADDPSLHRVVAVKILAPHLANNPQARKRFIREAVAIAAVTHDHVITIHSIDESPAQPKIVMQYIAGRSLQEKLDTCGSLELKEILRIGMQTAAGLAAAHAQGLIHRDVKPSNILLENGVQRVKLTDFGLARAVDDASLTQSGVISGTPQYMAPEQANGDAVDYRADLFSLGSVMYAMCTGHSPFRASTTMGVLKRVCHDPARPIQELNSDIPGWLCNIIMKLLAKSPADRFQSAQEVATLLEKWLAHVQRPNAVKAPAVVSPPPQPSASRIESPPSPTVITRRMPSESIDARTIFFQSISGKWLLFFMLAGTAVGMGIVRSQVGSHNYGEMLLVGLMFGFYSTFFGMLFVAVSRFFKANFLRWQRRHWPTDAAGLDGSQNETTFPADDPSTGMMAPENVGVLAGIIAMLLMANPILAAIIAIIAWRIASSRQKRSTVQIPPNAPAPNDVKPARWLAKWFSTFAGFWKSLRSRIVLAWKSSSNDLLQLCQVIGWCIAGGIDLAASVFLLMLCFSDGQGPTIIPLLCAFAAAMAFAIGSFATAHCLYVYENLKLLRILSFIGLTPLSAGAVIRIPFSIATLVWLHRPDVQLSFAQTPWRQTRLGHAISNRMVPFLWRGFWTVIYCVIWTLLCGGLTAYLINFYEIPRNLMNDSASIVRHVALILLWLIGFWGIIWIRHRTRRVSNIVI